MNPKRPIPESLGEMRLEIRLGESTAAVQRLFANILKARVSNGDRFVASIREASTHNILTSAVLDPSACSAPVPHMPFSCDKVHYYRIQALAALNHTRVSPFCTGSMNEKPFEEYVARFTDFPPAEYLSPATYLIALHYLDVVQTLCPEHFLHSYNAHRLLLAAFVVALKYHEDREQRFSILAAHGRVTRKDLSVIEMKFLEAMQFNGFLSETQFEFLERDVVCEAIEYSKDQRITNFLLNENIRGVRDCLNRALIKGTRTKMPCKVECPRVKSEYYNELYLETDEDVRAANHFLLRQAQQKWIGEKHDFMISCKQAQRQAIEYSKPATFGESLRIAAGFGVDLDRRNIFGLHLTEGKLFAPWYRKQIEDLFSSSPRLSSNSSTSSGSTQSSATTSNVPYQSMERTHEQSSTAPNSQGINGGSSSFQFPPH